MTSILQFMVQQQQLLVLKLLFVRVLGVMENQWEEEAWKGREEAWKGREEAREEVGLAIKFMDTATLALQLLMAQKGAHIASALHVSWHCHLHFLLGVLLQT